MYTSTLATLALLSAASAQTTTSLFLPGFDEQSIVASIIGSDATATTYSLACGNVDSEECGIPSSFTFTQGPSTIHYDYNVSEDGSSETINLGCKVTTDHGICSASMSGNFDGTSTNTVATTTFTKGQEGVSDLLVTITGGAAVSSANTAASTTASTTKGSSGVASQTSSASRSGAAASGSGMTTATSTSALGTKATGASSSSGSVGSAAGSASSTAGMAMITGKPQWALGGAAAVLAFAAM